MSWAGNPQQCMWHIWEVLHIMHLWKNSKTDNSKFLGLDERDLHFTADEVSVRWKCVRRFTVKHHHLNFGLCKLLKKREQSHKCIFSLGIKALLLTFLIWMFFYLALAKLMLHPLVVKFNILKCSLLLNVVLVCLSVRAGALQALIQSLNCILD